jgi:hypothetical protein
VTDFCTPTVHVLPPSSVVQGFKVQGKCSELVQDVDAAQSFLMLLKI